jgi:nucleoside-diphosphate-sugar epimerase
VPVRGLLGAVPLLRPVLPDPGVRLQLVHEDDVASAFVLGVTGAGSPGVYNLAAAGTITIGEIASAMNWHALPVPHVTLDGTSELVRRVRLAPAASSWVHFLRRPPLVSSARARRELAWMPMHTAHDALVQMAWATC